VSELFAAVRAGDKDAVTDVLERRPELAAERNAEGLSPVLGALYAGRDELVDAILDVNPALDVFDTAAVGRTRGLEELLEADPALVRARTGDGSTPLHPAARFDQRAAVELLLEWGADTATTDADGRTPADVAGDDTRELF